MIDQKTSKGSDFDEHILLKVSLFGHSTFLLKAFFSVLHEEILTVSGGWLRTPVSSVFKILWSFKCSSSFILFLAKFLPTLYFSSGFFIFLRLQKNELAEAFFLSFSFQSLFFFHRQWQFMGQHCKWKDKHFLDKNHNIFQTTRFNQTMIFSKLINECKLSDIYISHNNCLGTYVNYIVIIKSITRCVIIRWSNSKV